MKRAELIERLEEVAVYLAGSEQAARDQAAKSSGADASASTAIQLGAMQFRAEHGARQLHAIVDVYLRPRRGAKAPR